MDSTTCHRCGAGILTGISNAGRAAAVSVTLDPRPLDPAQELSAITRGRLTWTLHATGDVYRRTAAVIMARPAGHVLRQTVHADHRCKSEGEP